MIRVTIREKKRSFLWLPILASLIIHFGLASGAANIKASKPKVYGTSRVELAVVSPPPQPPKQLPVPEPPKPKPQPPKKVHVPKANRTPAPETPKPDTQPPKAVFGVTEESLAKGDSNVAIRVGNTLEKQMEKKFTPPEKVAAITQPPAPKPMKPVPVYELTETPSFSNKVEPVYPPEMRRDEVEGVVQLEVLIDENGKVRKVRVLAAPHKQLARAAVEALRRSKFKPARMGDRAVPTKVKIPYRFVLDA